MFWSWTCFLLWDQLCGANLTWLVMQGVNKHKLLLKVISAQPLRSLPLRLSQGFRQWLDQCQKAIQVDIPATISISNYLRSSLLFLFSSICRDTWGIRGLISVAHNEGWEVTVLKVFERNVIILNEWRYFKTDQYHTPIENANEMSHHLLK